MLFDALRSILDRMEDCLGKLTRVFADQQMGAVRKTFGVKRRMDMFSVPICKIRRVQRSRNGIKVVDRNLDLLHAGSVIRLPHRERKRNRGIFVADSKFFM